MYNDFTGSLITFLLSWHGKSDKDIFGYTA